VARRPWGFELTGDRIERLVERTDFDSPDSLQRFQVQLDRIGASKALEEAGAQPGDTVRVGELEFEYQP
jgi:GTP-binding protein